ncbi:MAG: hypothetical protein SVU69_00995 [Pseudomonadota bacterium]|nr:hypothetical protein [Pseudomonadota bacterium]
MNVDRQTYFLLGDLISNVGVGMLAGAVCALLVGVQWNMFVAMLIGMPIGMAVAFFAGSLVFFRFFGLIEVMVQTMWTGMLAGMFVAMAAAMGPWTVGAGATFGGLIGVVVFTGIYLLNQRISGPVEPA